MALANIIAFGDYASGVDPKPNVPEPIDYTKAFKVEFDISSAKNKAFNETLWPAENALKGGAKICTQT